MPCVSRLVAFLTLFLIFLAVISNAQQRSRLDEINETYYNQRQYTQAADAYQKLLAETTDVPTRAKIVFNLGMTFQMLKQYDKAIENFQQILTMNVDDNEPGGHIMELKRSYRPRAQWETGNSYFGKGDYERALAAYRTARGKYPINTGCGNCNESIERRHNIVEGITLERLGRFTESVVPYLKADESHLAELYFKTGQLEDLREIVNARNEPYISDLMRKYAWTREKASESLPLRNLKAALDAYDYEKEGNWQKLLKLGYFFNRSRSDDYGRNNIAITLLAGHGDKVLPLLKQEISKGLHASEFGIVYHVLALSQHDESIAFLKTLVEKNGLHWENAIILIRALNSAGEKGKTILNELETIDKTNLKIARELHGSRDDLDSFGRFEVKFPAIGEMPKLPSNSELQERRRQVAKEPRLKLLS